MTLSRQQKDLELWEKWRKTNNPNDLKLLMDRLKPLIDRETSKWSSTVARPALEAEAKMIVLDALKTYNPNRGAAIGTHVTSRLRKLSRSVYPQQNVIRLPENKQLLFNTYTISYNNLSDDLGRAPTVSELADNLAWTPKKVQDMQQSYGRRELVESEGAFLDADGADNMLVHFFYNDLAPQDKLLFEDITGYGGKRVMNNAELMRKHRLTQGQLSHRKSKLTKKLQQIQAGMI